MLLDDNERLKFADYLEMDAQSSEAIAEQMDKLGGPAGALATRERAYALAALVVASKLRQMESQTLAPSRREET